MLNLVLVVYGVREQGARADDVTQPWTWGCSCRSRSPTENFIAEIIASLTDFTYFCDIEISARSR